MPRKDGKPKGRMSSYAFFVQTCREEHKKKHPGESVVFAEFTRKCADAWKSMSAREKKRFEEMAEKDKCRYDAEMKNFMPSKDQAGGGKKRKKTKDPSAPKRALSGFFFFSAEERPKVRVINPTWTVSEVAKELGVRWGVCTEKPRFEAMAKQDKARYEKEMQIYKSGGKKPAAVSPAKKAKKVEEEEEEEDDDEEEEEEEEEESD